MKFINSLDQTADIKNNVIEHYNKIGALVASEKEKCFAQYTCKDVGNGSTQNKYYILTHNNVPYDPNGPDGHRELYLNLELKSVSKQTFDYYLMYLKTKNSLYMTRTQRNYING